MRYLKYLLLTVMLTCSTIGYCAMCYALAFVANGEPSILVAFIGVFGGVVISAVTAMSMYPDAFGDEVTP
jgi:uncharacterized membrane protein